MIFQNNLCRTCNTQCNNMVNIFSHGKMQSYSNLKSMLEDCTQTKLNENSEYPQTMCHNCVKQLEIAHRFLNRFFLAQSEFDEAQAYMRSIADDNSNLQMEKDLEEFSRDEPTHPNMRNPKNMLLKLTATQPVVHLTDEYVETFTEQLAPDIHDINKSAASRPKVGTALHPVVCYICHKSFLTSKALNLHLKMNHKQKALST